MREVLGEQERAAQRREERAPEPRRGERLVVLSRAHQLRARRATRREVALPDGRPERFGPRERARIDERRRRRRRAESRLFSRRRSVSRRLRRPRVARVADAGARICSTTREELFSRLNVSFEQHRDSDGIPSNGVTDEMNAIERSIKHACFATSYVVAALADVLRVDERRNALRFGDEVRGVKVDWAVGAAIAHEARDAFEVEEGSVAETSISVSSRTIDRAFANVANALSRASSFGVDASFARLFFFVGVVVLALLCLAFAGPFARAIPSDAPRATQAQLRLGELKVRRTLGMPSKGGVTSPTKRAAGEDARKGN